MLMREVNHITNVGMDVDVLTLGFARRATAYKRADLLFTDVERLRRISTQVGALQVVYAGKAHPRDQGGKELIQRIFQAMAMLGSDVKVAYLANYDMELAAKITAGVDVWLNTPELPMEASGTSGMKAAMNGVPSLSVLDGWWIEGHIEGITGWSIGEGGEATTARGRPIEGRRISLYQKLEQVVVPMYYEGRERLHRRDGPRHRAERLVLPHAADGPAVRAQRLFPVIRSPIAPGPPRELAVGHLTVSRDPDSGSAHRS